MDSQFWIKAWIDGRTAFHQKSYNQELIKYFSALEVKKNNSILVPLCGKSKDMLWLNDQGLNVEGIEQYEEAVKEFFTDNNLTLPERKTEGEFVSYALPHLTIKCGDFFKLNTAEKFDFIYDRAALVALPPLMRKLYAEVLKKCLKAHGRYLLITYEYDQSIMNGPPFSVDSDEVHALFSDTFSISLLETSGLTGDTSRLSTIEALKQKVYLLKKI